MSQGPVETPKGQLEMVIEAVRRQLARKIAASEEKGEMPDEAVVMVETKAYVVFGGQMTREDRQKKWLEQRIKEGVPKDAMTKIIHAGASHAILPVDNQSHVHLLHEMIDVRMTLDAVKRLKENQEKRENGKHDSISGTAGQGA